MMAIAVVVAVVLLWPGEESHSLEGKQFTNSIGMTLAPIPAGQFAMGSESGDPDEKPVHGVSMTKPFYMGVHEVTNAQYRQFQRESGYDGKSDADRTYLKHFSGQSPMSTSDSCPVVYVSWKNAVAFCDWLSRKNGEEGRTYRLPTEAEWEYASRAGTTTKYYWGEDISERVVKQYAWYMKNADEGRWTSPHAAREGTQPVGQKKPNGWGLYDMSGNVDEWCADWYDSGYYAKSPQNDPQGPSSGRRRVLRGGSWYDRLIGLRCADRRSNAPTYTSRYHGFRVVCEARSAEDSR